LDSKDNRDFRLMLIVLATLVVFRLISLLFEYYNFFLFNVFLLSYLFALQILLINSRLWLSKFTTSVFVVVALACDFINGLEIASTAVVVAFAVSGFLIYLAHYFDKETIGLTDKLKLASVGLYFLYFPIYLIDAMIARVVNFCSEMVFVFVFILFVIEKIEFTPPGWLRLKK